MVFKVVFSVFVGIVIVEVKGRCIGEFFGFVIVLCGCLSVRGGSLIYSEVLGNGILKGNFSVIFVFEDRKDGDLVNISVVQMSLDVDINVLMSIGGVKLVSGEQMGCVDKLIFDEDCEFVQFIGMFILICVVKQGQKEFVISGDEVWVFIKDKMLYVSGGVKLVQGMMMIIGDVVYYNDDKDVVYVVGNVVSVDFKSKVMLCVFKSGYLEQNIKFVCVSVKNGIFNIFMVQFKLCGEK